MLQEWDENVHQKFLRILTLKKDVSSALNRVPLPHLLASPFRGTPLPLPQGRRLLWMVPNKNMLNEIANLELFGLE